jgi:hypothetical protein
MTDFKVGDHVEYYKGSYGALPGLVGRRGKVRKVSSREGYPSLLSIDWDTPPLGFDDLHAYDALNFKVLARPAQPTQDPMLGFMDKWATELEAFAKGNTYPSRYACVGFVTEMVRELTTLANSLYGEPGHVGSDD